MGINWKIGEQKMGLAEAKNMEEKEGNGMGRLEECQIEEYLTELRKKERSENTILCYGHSIRLLKEFAAGKEISKELLLEWKEYLKQNYAASSVNGMLAAVNGFFIYYGRKDLCMKPVKQQRLIFSSTEKELAKEEYMRLVNAAKASGKERLALALQTICSTGIRISELKYITVEALTVKKAEIDCKGKQRIIFLPPQLIRLLRSYAAQNKIDSGPIFVTRSGRTLDRSNVWRDMKKLCRQAGVDEKKVFPHNLRCLFARTYYSMKRDISKLADLLGHSSIDTTRIYMRESGALHARQVEQLHLVLT